MGRFNYKFTNLCGSVYSGANLLFTNNGSTLISSIGNHVTLFHLHTHKTQTMPFTTVSNIVYLALHPNNQLLVCIDKSGRAIFTHIEREIILWEISFNGNVTSAQFSPNGKYIAIAIDQRIEVWKVPPLLSSYRPMQLYRKLIGHYAQVTCLNWNTTSEYIVSGSDDLSAHVYSLNRNKSYYPLSLTGHRTSIVGAWFGVTGIDEADKLVRVYTVTMDGQLLEWKFFADEVKDDKDGKTEKLNKLTHKKKGPKGHLNEVDLMGIKGRFHLSNKHYFSANTHGTTITAATLYSSNNLHLDLLLVSFTDGHFSLYELPLFTLIHSLSVSSSALSTLTISPTGDYLAVASKHTGALFVWEWSSETYILKQQGHMHSITTLNYSPDGNYIVTGSDDGKIKVWNTYNGYCFITFTDHTAPITQVIFGNSNTIYTASRDGTIRCYDLMRYRLFRTLTTPTPTQFSCMCIDNEILVAAAYDPFDIYIFTTTTGRILDVMSGHLGPITSLNFIPRTTLLVSSSWDKQVKLWDYTTGKCTESLEHNSDLTAVTIRPDGLEMISAALDGQLYVWDLDNLTLKYMINGKKDIQGGRSSTQVLTAKTNANSAFFTTVTYSSDGTAILCGGNSRFICVYNVENKLLIKRWSISRNESLEGIKDKLNSRYVNTTTNEEDNKLALPGARTGDKSSRIFNLDIKVRCLKFSPTGLQFTAATTEGLLLYTLDEELLFDPTDLDIDITPANIEKELTSCSYHRALLMSLRLNEPSYIIKSMEAVPINQISLLIRGIPQARLNRLLVTLASQVESSARLDFYLHWCNAICTIHSKYFNHNLQANLPIFRYLYSLIKKHQEDISNIAQENTNLMTYLLEMGTKNNAGEGLEEEKETEKEIVISVKNMDVDNEDDGDKRRNEENKDEKVKAESNNLSNFEEKKEKIDLANENTNNNESDVEVELDSRPPKKKKREKSMKSDKIEKVTEQEETETTKKTRKSVRSKKKQMND